MELTSKYGHLKELPTHLKVGDKVNYGDYIGYMGTTGKSTGVHLHHDLFMGIRNSIWRLADIEISREHAEQSAYFATDDLIDGGIIITSYYCDPNYKDKKGKLILHPAYDIIPKTSNFRIKWNRNYQGTIQAIGNDIGYGNYILISYEV